MAKRAKKSKKNMHNKAIKYRIYPSLEQEEYFSKVFGCTRKIWNLMLNDRQESYKTTGKQIVLLPKAYKEDYPYLKEVDSLALCNAYLDLNKAYKDFFKNPKHFKLPKFKSKKNRKDSYTINNQDGTIAIIDNKYIKLPKAGLVEAKIYRSPKDDWSLKSATISRNKAGEYYASVLFEFKEKIKKQSLLKVKRAYENDINNKENTNAKPKTTKALDTVIGLDYKSDGLYTDSNGVTLGSPKFYRKSQKKLAKAQRKLAKKLGFRKGETKSNNYIKQLEKIAKISNHISNQRKDFLHKESTKIANSYDVVCVESLNMKNMSNKGFHNGKATLDNGYGMFLNFLEYKLKNRGKYFIKVDKWFPSSQICSKCGHTQKMPLDVRTYVCPECGNIIDRDINAAINIKNEGLRLLLESA